ncbi:MAG: carbohydrate ABC transporter permease [Lachnospiraceae bacterium]|nr:carbohydrate ABC transporter permease [Lachnospiraceae bacterium]
MKKKRKLSWSDGIITLLLLLLFVITFYPFWNIFVLSLNDASDSLKGGIMLWPRVFTLDSYKAVFSNQELWTSLRVTVARTVLGVPLNLACNCSLAYVLSRRTMPGRKWINLFFVATMYFSGGLIPTYMVIKSFGLLDNFLVFLLPGAYNVYWMILIRTYIDNIPDSLFEAAKLDGANDIQVFLRVVIPSCKPVLATIALFSAIGHWNAWYDSYIYTSDPNLTTLSSVLVKILNQYQTGDMMNAAQQMAASAKKIPVSSESIRMATTMVVTIPIIIVYPFVQKYFISGIMLGSVKE